MSSWNPLLLDVYESMNLIVTWTRLRPAEKDGEDY